MLTKDVANVGKAGDVKDVTDGYGRNFLLPRKLAVRAHQGVEAEAKRLQDAAVKRETKDRVAAQALADEIDNKTVVVRLKVGAEDKAFGSITNQDIASALTPGRVPPHDLDAETSVLGSILLDPLSIAKVLQFLHPEDFYRENNGQVYRAALDLFAAGEPIDNVTLAAQLQTMGMLDRIGGRT